jgi:hypothetical protein
MEEDAEALEMLYGTILRLFPPGPRRAFQLHILRAMAIYTRCPHWPLGREFFVSRICREAELRQRSSVRQVNLFDESQTDIAETDAIPRGEPDFCDTIVTIHEQSRSSQESMCRK